MQHTVGYVVLFAVVFCVGAVAVVNSEECLIWLEQVLQSLWIPFGDAPSLYRGLPLVILALDDSIMDSKSNFSSCILGQPSPHFKIPFPLPLFPTPFSLPPPPPLTPVHLSR